jgi:hypothetical protein
LWSGKQVDGRYRFGAVFANAITPTVHALHRGLCLEEIGASSRQRVAPGTAVDDGENLYLPPPEILQLFS